MISQYLFCSIRRRPLRHLSICWIMLCAFLLPLVVSTYRDSLEYGGKLQLYDFSRASAFHISGAAPEDLDLFRGIDGLTDPFYEDGTIYLSYESEEFWKTCDDLELLNSMSDEEIMAFLTERERIENALHSAMAKSSRALSLMGYAYDMWSRATEGSDLEIYMQKMRYLNIALLLFSGMIVCSAYGNHITEFSQEMTDLCTLGATKGQLVRLFLAELGVLFPLAAAGAVGLSGLVMRYLYEYFLGSTTDSMIWEVFYMNPRTTALEILFYFLLCLCALLVAVLRSPKRRERKIRGSHRTATLPKLWVRCTRPPYFPCLLILVPLLTAFLSLFNRYLSTYALRASGVQSATVVATYAQGFSQAELNAVRTLSGIQSIKEIKDNTFLLLAPDGGSVPAAVHSYRDCPSPLSTLADIECAAALPSGGMVGDTYYLMNMQTQEFTPVTLAQVLPAQGNPSNSADVYVTDATLQTLMENVLVTKLEICADAQRAASLEEELRGILPGDCQVVNSQTAVATDMERQVGRLLLLCWIFCILLVAAVQIIGTRLARYVADCGAMLRIIQQVGASYGQLSQLFPVRCGALPAMLLPFAIALPLAWLDASQNNRPWIVSAPVLGIYLAAAALAGGIFWLPVKTALKKVLKATK